MVAFREVGAAIGLGLRVAGVARRFFLAVGSGFVASQVGFFLFLFLFASKKKSRSVVLGSIPAGHTAHVKQ